jgi:predicted TIM-barrel fold metal-dependent hydrolase
MVKKLLLFIISGYCAFSIAEQINEVSKYSQPITDMHVHYLNFVQQTDGMNSFINSLNEANVSDAIFTGMGLSEEWNADEREQPRYYLDSDTDKVFWDPRTDYLVANAYLRSNKQIQKRLHPFASGFNGNDKSSGQYLQLLLSSYPGVFQGIGEIFGHHDSLGHKITGSAPNPTSSGYKILYQIAAKYRMPVLLHSNITTWSQTDNNRYLPEMEEILKDYPNTNFIWAHAGMSRFLSVKNLTPLFDKLLTKYPNLNFDISWFAWEGVIYNGNKLDPLWKALIIKYPTRFMIGSDFVGKFKDASAYSAEIHKFDVLLYQLPPGAAKNVAHDNFLNLLPPPVVLKAEDRMQL